MLTFIDVYIPTSSGDFIYKNGDFLHDQWGFSYNDEELAIVDRDFFLNKRYSPQCWKLFHLILLRP